MQLQGKNEFDGAGKINNSEQILARIATQVIDVRHPKALNLRCPVSNFFPHFSDSRVSRVFPGFN